MTLDVTYNARLRVIRVDFVVTLSRSNLAISAD